MLTVIAVLVGIVVGTLATAAWLRWSSSSRLAEAEAKRRRLVVEGEREAEALRREAQIEAREQAVRLRGEIEDEVRDRRVEIAKVEERVNQKESELDTTLDELSRREQGVSDREIHAKELQEELKAAKDNALKELERISGLTTAEAKQVLLERSEDLIRHELARRARPRRGGPHRRAPSRAPSSPTRSSVWPRAIPRRRPSPSSSLPRTT